MDRTRLLSVLLSLLPFTMASGQDCPLPSGNFLFLGDFGFGPDNVAPDTPYLAPSWYTYTLEPPLPAGAYTVTNNTAPWAQAIDGAWLEVEDLSGSPEGYMLLVNSTAEPTVFWEQTVNLCSGTEYQLFLDALNLYSPDSAALALPSISLYINGVFEANLGELPQNGEGQFLSHSFSLPDVTDEVLIELRNDTPGEDGNDFAVDNINLQRCGQAFDVVELAPAARCPGDTIRLLAELPMAYNGYWLRWQVSSDGGQSWVDFGLPTDNPAFLAEGIPINASFRVYIAETEEDLFNGLCLVFSNSVDIAYRAPEDCLDVITTFSGLCTGELGENVFPDGDFGSGEENILPFDPGLAPGYVYEFNPPPNDGTYTITNNTEPWGDFAFDTWINIGDNSPDPNGYMMVVNAIPEPGLFYTKTIQVCENTLYEYSTDIISVNRPSISDGFTEPNISFLINGVAVFNTGNVPIDSTWRTFGFTFTTAPGVSELTLALRNNTPGGGGFVGNDLALDNISLRACGPQVNITERTGSPYCPGGPISLSATVGSGFDDPQIQWQLFDETTGEWEDFGAPGFDTLITLPALALGNRFRVLVAETFQNLDNENCRVVSQEFLPVFEEVEDCFDSPVNMEGTICNGQLGFSAVPDGDFGAGPEVFGSELPAGTSSYAFQDTAAPAEGFYTLLNFWEEDICPDTLPVSCWFLPIEDNSEDPEGYGMVVNGDGGERQIIYTADAEEFCENTTYQFSAAVFNLSHPSFAPFNAGSPDSVVLPKLDFIVGKEGTPVELLQVAPANYNTGDILNDTTWNTYGFTFTVQPGVSALTFAIRNNAPAGFGNDFIIDNISISPCGGPMAIQREAICPGESVTLEGIFGNSFFPNPAIQWQESTDEGLSWTNLPGETNNSLFLASPTAGQQYRFLIAENPANLSIPTCLIPSPVDTIGFLVQFADTLNQSICQGESLQLGNNTFSETGVYQVPFTAANGCDSIVTLALNVHPVFDPVVTQAICDGSSFLFDGQMLTEAGVYTGQFQSIAGCDSTVSLSLQVLPALRENISAEICAGESFTFGEDELTEEGDYERTLTASNGCDSLAILDLMVWPRFEREEGVQLCRGDAFQGIPVFSDTTITFNGQSAQGCDSTLIYRIQVEDLTGFSIAGEGQFCGSGSTTLSASGSFASYSWSSGETTSQIIVDKPGLYALTVTSALGCTATDSLNVEEVEFLAQIEGLGPLCNGEQSGAIRVTGLRGGTSPFSYSLDGGAAQDNGLFNGLAASTYQLLVRDAGGCEIREEVVLNEPAPPQVSISGEENIALGDSTLLQAEQLGDSLSNIQWQPTTGLSCTSCLEPTARPTMTTTYIFSARDPQGCLATFPFTITVEDTRSVYVPTAFSPNDDGVNDFFAVFPGQGVERILQFKVFDRWGNTVFDGGESMPGAIPRWDGSFRGQRMNPAVFAWYLEVAFVDGTTGGYKGEIMLVW